MKKTTKKSKEALKTGFFGQARGGAAKSIKAYMEEVHLTMIKMSVEIFSELLSEFKKYKERYVSVEGAPDFVLPESEMEDFTDKLKTHENDVSDICAATRNKLSGVWNDNGELQTAETYADEIYTGISGLVTDVENFSDEIYDIETSTAERLKYLQECVEKFEKCVAAIGAIGWTGPNNYQKGSFFKSTIYAEMAEAAAKAYLISEGFTIDGIENMETLGYSAVDLRTMYNSCTTDADKQIFDYIMGQNDGYKGMFDIYPDNLSMEMDLILADYTARLLEYDMEKFIEMNNELLWSDMWPNKSPYRDLWLDLLSKYSLSVLSMTIGEDERKRILHAADIWNTENVFIGMLPDADDMAGFAIYAYGFRVEDINFDGTYPMLKISFDVKNASERYVYTLTMHEKQTRGFTESVLNSLDLAQAVEALSANAIIAEIIQSILEIGSSLGLGVFTGGVGTLIGLIGDATMSAYEIIEGINSAMTKMSEKELELFSRWFGMGTFFSISVDEGSALWLTNYLGITEGEVSYTSFMGCYDPEIAKKMADWQENGMDWYWTDGDDGIDKFLNDGKDKTWFLAELEKINEYDLEYICDEWGCDWEDVEKIITGEYDFTSGNFDALEFSKQINAANEILQRIYGEDIPDIKSSWDDHIE